MSKINGDWRRVEYNSDDLQPCVYKLFKGEDIVYIGQTKHGVYSRLVSHKKTKDFDSVFVMNVPTDDLNDIEATLILENMPKYNKSVPKSNKFATLKEFKTIVNAVLDEQGADRITILDVKKAAIESNLKPFGRVPFGKEYFVMREMAIAMDKYLGLGGLAK